MARTRTMNVVDPRDPSGETTLEVEYTAKAGTPDGWEEPGDPPEYELEKAINECGMNVLGDLDADQCHTIWEKIAEDHDWSLDDDYYDD